MSLKHLIIAARSSVHSETAPMLFPHRLFELAHETESARLPPPVPLVPHDVRDLFAVDHVQAEKRVVNLVAVDFPDDADAAVVHFAEHRDAVAHGKGRNDLVAVPLLALLDQPRQALLFVAAVAHPKRDSLLPDTRLALRLEVDVNIKFGQRVESPLRFRDVEWNHVRRDDEEFRIRVSGTPSERVAE